MTELSWHAPQPSFLSYYLKEMRSIWISWAQARREGGVGGKLPRTPRRLGGPAVGQKYEVHQNVPFWKKLKNFLPRGAPWKCLGAPQECFPGRRCGSRRAWLSRKTVITCAMCIYFAATIKTYSNHKKWNKPITTNQTWKVIITVKWQASAAYLRHRMMEDLSGVWLMWNHWHVRCSIATTECSTSLGRGRLQSHVERRWRRSRVKRSLVKCLHVHTHKHNNCRRTQVGQSNKNTNRFFFQKWVLLGSFERLNRKWKVCSYMSFCLLPRLEHRIHKNLQIHKFRYFKNLTIKLLCLVYAVT